MHLLCLISIADNSYMKSHSGSELCASSLLNFHCWQCLHEIPSSMWVVCSSSAWFWLLTMPAWNPIQRVSCVCLLCSISIADNACMKSHPACESCAPPLLNFYCWQCLHEILSREWVVCASSAWFLLLTMPAWNPIQAVSCVHLLCLISITDNVCMKSHSACELCASSTQFPLLIMLA